MISNLSIRAKLGLLLFAPLLALLAFAGITVADRFEAAQVASDATAQLEAANSAMFLIRELGFERSAAVQLLVTSGQGREDTDTSRSASDNALADFTSRLDNGSLDESIEARALSALQRLAISRQQVDTFAVDQAEAYEQYNEIIGELLLLETVVLTELDDSELLQQGRFTLAGLEAKERILRQTAFLGPRLELFELTSPDFVTFAGIHNEELLFFSELQGADEISQLWQESRNSTSAIRADELVQRVNTAGQGGAIPDVSADVWRDQMGAKVIAFDSSAVESFEILLENANSKARSAQSEAILFALLGFLTILLAVSTALALARSIARRLRFLSEEARTIANERLPEVLESLTPEALAGAMPTIGSDATDEIGVMANSFDTVLRGWVETSIEYSQQRAQSVTDLLVSLEGRYALAFEAGSEGVWEYDSETNMFEVNGRFTELAGLEPTERQLTVRRMHELFGLDPLGENIQEVVTSWTDATNNLVLEPVAIEIKGETRWFEGVGYPLVEEGKVTRIIGLIDDITERMQRDQELLYRATHDPLTGLANRRLLLERLGEALRQGTAANLLYLDLDQFKVVNDSLGHKVGDELLQVASKRLAGTLGPNDLLARLGGDEFAVLTLGNSQAGQRLAERLLHAFTDPLVVGSTEIYTTVSIGTVHTDGQQRDAIELLASADLALYRAKSAGKNCVRSYETYMRVEADHQLELRNKLQRAIKNEEFVVLYQPILDATTLRLTGFEALLRWRSDGELVSPAGFLPYLEKSGSIIDVGELVIRDAVAQLRAWVTTIPGAENLTMSLNLSRVQFRSPNLVDAVLEAVRESGVAPSQFTVEVTETAILDDGPCMIEALHAIREGGVRVAVDDFGVGQSTLNALDELPADMLKIDRAFVARIDHVGPHPIIEAIVTMARSVGLKTTAEGVETEVQRESLAAIGCDNLQGYLFGRPMTPGDMEHYFLRSLGPENKLHERHIVTGS